MIAGNVTRRENGIISLAGPLTNYLLAGVFFIIAQSIPLFQIGYFINLWLGLFNMIPFGNFDGRKIMYWNIYVWLVMVATGIYLLFS